MANLKGSVGKGGDNAAADVKLVQQLLGKFAAVLGVEVKVDGKSGKSTEKAIETFQKQVVAMGRADGLVEPDGRTWRALNGSVPKASTPPKAAAASDPKTMSGTVWWKANEARFPNSAKVTDLASGFQSNVKAFLAALDDAGAEVEVSSTLRNKDRAWLMHWSWQLSRGKVKADQVPSNAAVKINWDHGDVKASQDAAKEMVSLFRLKYEPSLTSRHIEGKAIDMDISWKSKIEVANKAGKKIAIDSPKNGADNTDLHSVGASYGVIKLKSDPPHWSTDGK